MAGEWIKVELTTPDKPEVLRMSRILGIDKDAVFGKLIRLWAWFDRNSVDGVVDGVVDSDVDALCYQTGFSAALVSVGWISFDSDAERVSLPKFDRHNGESAKKRALKNEAQARWRANKDANVDTQQSTSKSTTASTREEKRREEINTYVASKLPTCPHQEILSLFADVLPELPQPRIWEGTREKNLASRWKWVMDDLKKKGKEQTKEAGLDFFRRMFGYIKESDFLMGRNASWSADLGWIVKGENFSKIIDGNYENKVAA